ncbi:MAG: rhomboid family intramembrane serine protease [Candidatus Levybacteria bacterium]|nr:rhomboid family intramembrane serine protease [Candidatus Levybacteria bacterium]
MIPISDAEHKPRRFPFINIALILINVYVFFLQLTTSDPEGFIYTYALVPANINFSDWSTLYPFITSMFLHGSILHIASNMIFLWVFGDNVEGEMPPFVYLILYLGSGIVGGLSQYMLAPASTLPMLGASGAVAGALGAYFILFPHHQIKTLILLPFFLTTARISASVMLGYWIVLQIISGSGALGQTMGQEGGVAYFAHIGGFLAGIVFAWLFARPLTPERFHE